MNFLLFATAIVIAAIYFFLSFQDYDINKNKMLCSTNCKSAQWIKITVLGLALVFYLNFNLPIYFLACQTFLFCIMDTILILGFCNNGD